MLVVRMPYIFCAFGCTILASLVSVRRRAGGGWRAAGDMSCVCELHGRHAVLGPDAALSVSFESRTCVYDNKRCPVVAVE